MITPNRSYAQVETTVDTHLGTVIMGEYARRRRSFFLSVSLFLARCFLFY